MNQDLSRNGKEERPLSETAGFAKGDPFKEHNLPEDFANVIADELARPDRHEDAAGKELCGMCGHKVKGKGWRCSKLNLSAKGPGIPAFTCPAPGAACYGFSKKPTVQRPPQPKKKGLPVPPGVKFLYFGRPKGSHDHHGVVTVAWIEPSPGTLHLGFSFCSPKDPWHKTTGRDIALTRLLHPLVIPFLYSPRRTVHEVTRAVMSHDFVRLAAIAPGVTMWGIIPSWTKDLAKRMWPKKITTEFSKTLSYKLLTRRQPRSPKPLITFISTPRHMGKSLFFKYCVEEPAEISPEAWERLENVLRRTRPRPSPLDIITRMFVDIAPPPGPYL